MRKDKEVAIALRRSGKSYKQIMNELRVPRATLSDWFSKIGWSVRLKRRLTRLGIIKSAKRLIALNDIRGKHLTQIYNEARQEARKEFETLKYNPLFIAGIMLYWGEGDKRTKQTTKLTNTEPEMIRLFVHFLKNVCAVPSERIRASLVIYPDLNSNRCIEYWSKQSAIPRNKFIKSSVISGRHRTRKLSNGICLVYVSSTYFKVKILEWLSLLPHELMSKKYYASI